MRTKKIHFNGKAEVLVDFLTKQYPKTYLEAFKVLLDLKYPIVDSQVFYDHIEKLKADEFVKELLLNNFIPTDFSLESPINALEKFQLNIKRNNIPMSSYGAYDYPFEFKYGKMPVPEYSMYDPYLGYRTSTPFESKVFPKEQFNPLRQPSYYWPQWNMQKDLPEFYMGKDWKFGKDIFGEVAIMLFGELVSKGIKKELAYSIAHEKEIACRSYLPTFETEFNEKALFIFANNFILLGKDVKQSYWAAKFFLKNYYTDYVKTEPIARSYEPFYPKMKKEFVEPVM